VRMLVPLRHGRNQRAFGIQGPIGAIRDCQLIVAGPNRMAMLALAMVRPPASWQPAANTASGDVRQGVPLSRSGRDANNKAVTTVTALRSRYRCFDFHLVASRL
jgi:hypothetical protein